METQSDNDECKCSYCGRSYINKNGKCLEDHNIRLHELKCKEETEKKKSKDKKRKGPMDMFFKPMAKKLPNLAVTETINTGADIHNNHCYVYQHQYLYLMLKFILVPVSVMCL